MNSMRLDCILCDVVFDVSESRANAAAEAKAASSYPHFHAPLTDAMTNDGSSFLRQVQGQRFLAHKVIMSSASRWLAALLHDHNNALPIQLPQLSPDGFAGVLGYIYGEPLSLTLQTASDVLPVLRLLELQQLEEQCWGDLMRMTTPVKFL